MSSGETRNPVEELAEEFMRKRRNGESPSIESYARKYSEHAEQIRELFPTLEMMEHVRQDVVQKEVFETTPLAQVGQTLGDFQILREIGRGGMGIVYEAQQISLGRRVALKVLSAHLQRKTKYLERFKREAKAAANLQHANIVPVYGVAEEQGHHFYVMQFIFGCGLDEVFDALRRNVDNAQHDDHSVSADGLANALATGQFRSHDSQLETKRYFGNVAKPMKPPTESKQGNSGAPVMNQNIEGHNCSAKQKFSNNRNSSSSIDGNYFRRIAELGQQAADALAYAHRNGILHRDIKPGNLLLDVFGNIWITDFGLVKMTGEEALTETGDIVGTLRYIAPECLRGQFDERSDVYGLGLTLHEMLARENAFSAISRGELTQQILQQGPASLQHVPRDLSTIIQKATSLDPANRYRTAADFADDLGHFLGSQPIRARRSSVLERFWSWSKRNRKLAASLAACLLLLLAGLISSLIFSFQLNEYAKDRQSAFLSAETESKQAKRRMVEANIARAKTLAASQTPGQRMAGLATIRESIEIARELQMGPETIDQLRTAAISCLANVDIVTIKEWEGKARTESDVAFNTQLDTYVAQPVNKGPVEIRRVLDQSIISRIDGQNYWGHKWISPDGRFVCVTQPRSEGGHHHIYEVASAELIYDLGPQKNWKRSKLQFNATSDKIAFANADGFVRVYSIGDSDPIFELSLNADSLLFGESDQLFVFRKKLMAPSSLIADLSNQPKAGFLQRLKTLLLSLAETKISSVAEIYSISTGKLIRSFELTGETRSAAIGPGRLLAVVGILDPDPRSRFSQTETEKQLIIELFELSSEKPIVQLTQNVNATQDVAFDETGRVLIVNLHNKFALYEVRTGNRLLVGPGVPKATDGRRIVCDRCGKFGIFELVLPEVYRGLVAKKTHSGTQIDPHEAFLISPDFDALRFFDLDTGALLGQVENYPCGYARITPNGESLLVIKRQKQGTGRELDHWPINRTERAVTIGPPETITIADDFTPHHLAMDHFGQIVACDDTVKSKIGLRFLKQDRQPIVMDGPDKRPQTLMFVAVSNDLRWAASGTWHGDYCAIYDVAQGKLVHKLFTGKSSVQFTNDSRYLICGSGRAVEMNTWNEFQIDTGEDQMRFLRGFKQPQGSDYAFVALQEFIWKNCDFVHG